jgi:proteasome lid subunit RPN8/RPN11
VDEELPDAPFPVPRRQDFRVCFSSAAHEAIHSHASADVSVEICGVLVGRLGRDEDGPFVEIREIIRADAAASKFAEVTFTHESWSKINEVMDSKFADLKIVGWYHSHPDFGIFLSDRDVFIQQNFFSGPGQVAHVVDPVRGTEGVFVWHEGKPVPCAHYWVGATVQTGAAREQSQPVSAEPAAAASQPAAMASDSEPLSPLWRWSLMLLLAFLIGYLLAGNLAQRRTDWERQMLFAGVAKHYQLWKVLRPNLKLELDAVNGALQSTSESATALAEEHVDLAGKKSASVKKQWRTVLTNLQGIQNRLAAVEALYCLNDDERAIIRQFFAEAERERQGKRPSDSREKAAGKQGDKKTKKTKDDAQEPDASRKQPEKSKK